MNNYDKLCDILKTNPNLTADNGELLKNKIQELARKMDETLLETLLTDGFTKEMFFKNIQGIEVFDANKFSYMIDSKKFLPSSYTKFKQNIILSDGSNSIKNSQNVVLEFPNKDCILEFDSTDTDKARDEVFLNETLMKEEIDALLDQKVFVNAIKHTADGENAVKEVSIEDNLLIKGNNLLILNSLYPKYKEQIKLMYWDILYNTENDNVPYNDNFKHSSWLTMIKNRLEIAKKLLKKDGTICLQCDDNEHAYLKVLCDEVFGRDKYMTTIVVKMSEPTGFKMKHADIRLPKIKEYILVYKMNPLAKINVVKTEKSKWDSEYKTILLNISKDELNFINDVRDNENRTLDDVKKVNELLKKCECMHLSKYYKENNIIEEDRNTFNYKNAWRIFQTVSMPNKNNKENAINKRNELKQLFYCIISPQNKLYIIKGDFDEKEEKPRMKALFAEDYLFTKVCDMWSDIKTTGLDNEGVVELTNGKKPEALLKRIIEIFSNEGDIVLDAYVGSGTTSAVALKLNRKFIGIEQLDAHFEKATKRLNAVVAGEQGGVSKECNWCGGNSFVSFELAKNSQNILDEILASKTKNELSEIYNKLKDSPFILHTVDIEKMETAKDSFTELPLENQKEFLVSIIDKNTLYINYSDIDNGDYSIAEDDKTFTRSFYEE